MNIKYFLLCCDVKVTIVGGLIHMNYKKIVNDKGLKVVWLAKQIGMSRPMLSMCMSGKRNFKPDKKEKLHKLLGID